MGREGGEEKGEENTPTVSPVGAGSHFREAIRVTAGLDSRY